MAKLGRLLSGQIQRARALRSMPFRGGLLGGKGQFIKIDGVRRYALVSVNLIINGNAVPSCICRAVGPTEVGGFSVQRDGIE